MGVNISLHVYDYDQLVQDIYREVANKAANNVPEGRNVATFRDTVLPEFGILAGDKFVTLWNEYYSDSGYNSASELFRAVEMYFGIDDVFLSKYESPDSANAYEVLESLNIEPIEGDEDE